MRFIFRLILVIFIVLVIFALVPESVWQALKPYFNWDNFIRTLRLVWQRLVDFIRDSTGFDLRQIPEKIRQFTGIDFVLIWSKIKLTIAQLFERLAEIFR